MSEKRVSNNIKQLIYFNYYKGKSAKEIAGMFSLKIRTLYNIISQAKKEGRLDVKGSTRRPKKVTQRVNRKIMKTVYEPVSRHHRASCVRNSIVYVFLPYHSI